MLPVVQKEIVLEEGTVVISPFIPAQQERGDYILKLSTPDKSSVTHSLP